MTLSVPQVVEHVVDALTPHERAGAVAYLAAEPIAAGARIALPRLVVEAAAPSMLAFVDREPQANWGHSCRYLLVDSVSGAVSSFEASLPPFGPAERRTWMVAYQALSVPDSLLAVTRRPAS